VVRVLALGLPGTCVTICRCVAFIVPPHNGHSLVAGMILVLSGKKLEEKLASACRLDKPVIDSYR
jgi:hypothetical protein